MSLAEAIVACFILTAAMAVSAALYHTALNHSVRIDRKHRAARAVERRIEEIRSWSREQHGTNGPLVFNEGWAAFDDKTTQDSEYPEFDIETRIIERDLYSPSKAFEEISFAAQADKNVPAANKTDKRLLLESSYLIEVDGIWGIGPKNRLTARTLIADPVKDYGWEPNEGYKAIRLSATPSSMVPGERVTITASVRDARERLVKNAVVEWYIDPNSSGNGTIETRPGFTDQAVFVNAVLVDKDPDIDGDEITVHTGGSVRIVARVRLGGVEAVNKTEPIVLGTPPE